MYVAALWAVAEAVRRTAVAGVVATTETLESQFGPVTPHLHHPSDLHHLAVQRFVVARGFCGDRRVKAFTF